MGRKNDRRWREIRVESKMVHDGCMTLTVHLDPKADEGASAYAGAKGITLSDALSELVLDSEEAPAVDISRGRLETNEYGYPEIAETGYPLTMEMV